jgi:Cu(I)/Ag(I) efflux system membrane fusion protein
LKVQRLGVVTETVEERIIAPPVRAVGTIETNERTLNTVAPRFEGWIETLYANETGGAVRRGDPLFSAYSPDLVAAQQEYLLALEARAAEPKGLGESLLLMARERLRNWQIGEAEIAELERQGVPQRAVLFRSPIDGVVLEKNATEGARFMPGDALFLLADLRVVWMIASVYEQELSMLRLGQSVELSVEAFPGDHFEGRISFIYPTLATETRTARIRVEFDNEDLRLRPGMYGHIDVQPQSDLAPVVSVSDSAVLESGKRSVVLVQVAEGLFEPREVEIGNRGESHVEVRSGLAPGERVVVSANFLIDAESNLRAALDAFAKGSAASGAAEEN